MNLRTILLVCLISLIFHIIAMAGEPPTTPFIRINTEMHSAKIMDIAADHSGKLLATASFDKTVKIWNSADGTLVRTLRPPIGASTEGLMKAVAFSPDGSTIAVSGFGGKSWDKNYCVYFFSLTTGEMTARLSGLPQHVQRLIYSPDGKMLALGLANGSGIHVFNSASRQTLFKDERFPGNVFAMDYDQRGNLIAASDEGMIKRYRHDGKMEFEQMSLLGKRIFSIKLSPDSTKFAVGYEPDSRKVVDLLSANDGSWLGELTGIKGGFFSVTWSNDGKYIYAAGSRYNKEGKKILCRWTAENRVLDQFVALPLSNGIRKLLPLPDGRLVFSSPISGFGVYDMNASQRNPASSSKGNRGRGGKQNLDVSLNKADNGVLFFNTLASADFQKNHDIFKISADASSVQFSFERYGNAKAFFDLKTRRLNLNSENLPATDLLPPRITGNGLDITGWDSNNVNPPRLNGVPLKGYGSIELSRSLAVRHDETGFVLGSSHFLRSFDKQGKLLWIKRTPENAWDVRISADDRILVAALDDSTIRWYRLDNGRELYSLYLHPDRKRWVLWTPDGYFDHGLASESLIGFLVNRGAEKASTMVSVDQMYDIFYRPDIVDRAIAGEDISAYLQRLSTRTITAGIANVTPTAEKEKQASGKVATEKPAQVEAEKDRIQRESIRAEKTGQKIIGIPLPDDDSLPFDEPDETDDPADIVQNTVLTGLLNTKTLPPKVHFLSKSGSSESRDFTLKAELCDNGGGIGNVTLFLNNTPIAFERGGRGLAVRNKFASQDCQNFERVITLAPGQNIISLMAFNSDNSIESDRDRLTLNYDTTDNEKPRLHILTIAVNSYRDGDLRLKYSIKDAEGVIKMGSEKGRTLFSGIDIYRLHNEQVTKEKMEEIFTLIGAKSKRGDVFLLFMAGHGVTEESNGMYYFLPVDFRYTGQDSFVKQGISMNDFKRFMINIQAMKTLLLIDTCSSGSFSEAIASRGVTEKTALSKLARAVGRATISASSKNQVAMEGYEGHGVFSYTLLEGMRGKAADNKGDISINRLATFIEETLPELTFKKWGYEQIPQKSLIGSDFQIGVK